MPLDADLARTFRGAEFAYKIACFRFKICIAASSKSFRGTLTPTLSLRQRGTMKSAGEGICLSKDKLKLLKQPHRSLICLPPVRSASRTDSSGGELGPKKQPHAHSSVYSDVRQFPRRFFPRQRFRRQSFVCLTRNERLIARVPPASPSRAKHAMPRLSRPCRPNRSRRTRFSDRAQ